MGFFAVSSLPVASVRLIGAYSADEARRLFDSRCVDIAHWFSQYRDDLGRSIGYALAHSNTDDLAYLLEARGGRCLGLLDASSSWWLWSIPEGSVDRKAQRTLALQGSLG
jgi:hypothetical protein